MALPSIPLQISEQVKIYPLPGGRMKMIQFCMGGGA